MVGLGRDVRGESITSLEDLLTTKRWPGLGSWEAAGASAAGREMALSAGTGRVGAGVVTSAAAAGAALGRSVVAVLEARGCAAPELGVLAAAGAEAGSSGCTARLKPSRSALRRARSACASSIDDEWLLTPMPRSMQMSRASLLVSPSSRASS